MCIQHSDYGGKRRNRQFLPINLAHAHFHLPIAKRQTPTSLSQGGALSAPLEPLRRRSRRAVATLRSAHRDRSGLSGSEERFSHPPHLSPERLTHRGAYLRIVSGLLFVHHAGAALAGAGAWSNSSSGAGENVRYSNGGCAGTHNRWAVADPVAVHPTRERSPDASPRIAPTV